MSKSISPKVSIITAAYNSEKQQVKETYQSIIDQTYENWEWLVTDDCSTDNTQAILAEIAKQDDRVLLFKNDTNSGAAVARNKSLSHVTGEYIAFIDSDDFWEPEKLKKQIALMTDKQLNFTFTAFEMVDEQGLPLHKTVDTSHKPNISFGYAEMLKKQATLGCSTVMIRREAFSDLTMPLIRTGQDYAFWLKLLKTGERAYLLPEILTQYRIRPDSISRNKFKKAKRQWQIYREVEKISLIPSVINFCFYAWRAVFRK